ncbi:MAG: AraC family transcriptional regulator [Ferruginibacter sp.]
MREGDGAAVLKFEYQQSNFPEWIKQFASALGRTVHKDENGLSVSIGNGFSKALIIEEGFSCALHNYQLETEKIFIRKPAKDFGIIIYLCQFETSKKLGHNLNGTVSTIEPGVYNTLRLLDARTEQHFTLASGTKLNGISIYLEEEWLKKNISGDTALALDHLKSALQFKGFVSAKQLKLINEITSLPANHPYYKLQVKSRVYRLLDKMLEDLTSGVYKDLNEKLNETDFELLQKVEIALVSDFTEPFPSIEKLSKIALMSESKLKRLFKQAYGMGMYEYFQKNRLHQAKELLLAEKHTITEVGVMLGYQNLSNFSAAFRKEFNCLPSEISRLN